MKQLFKNIASYYTTTYSYKGVESLVTEVSTFSYETMPVKINPSKC